MKIFLPALLFLALSACSERDPTVNKERPVKSTDYLKLQGRTMGTTYNITYKDELQRHFQTEVDELLQEVNNEVSTYEENSTISKINRAGQSIRLERLKNDYFIKNFNLAKEVFDKSNGSFDPTVMPLVNYWGFGTTAKRAVTKVDEIMVDSLKKLIGFDKVDLIEEENAIVVTKETPGVGLDFSACAKGGAVDILGTFFRSKGIDDYLIDIGGELIAHGQSPRGKDWRIGISIPKEDARADEVHTVAQLTNMAVATSGNHRNYYKTKGYKYGHTLNPKTGYPEKNDLLSATVFAPTCIEADAYATAFMVMGMEKALQLAARIPEIEAFFIYGKRNGSMGVKYTKGTKAYLKQ